MVRPYAVKWLKRKRKRSAAAAEKHVEEVSEQEEVEEEDAEDKKRRGESSVSAAEARPVDERGEKGDAARASPAVPWGEEEREDPLQVLPGLPVVKPLDQRPKPGVIFILEKACLRVGKVGKKEQLLTSDDHYHFLKSKEEDPNKYRPDILHQALLAILDSPLNQAGRVQALYVKTDDGELIDIKRHVRLPRTFKRFKGLMYQLKTQKSIRSDKNREKLLQMIKNPVTKYLPVNSRKIGFSYSSERLVRLQDYVATIGDDATFVFVVGAMAHGKIEADYTDDLIKISDFPLSAACCLGRICNVLEQRWNIL